MVKKILIFGLIFSLILIVGCSCETKTNSTKKNTPTTKTAVIAKPNPNPQTYTVIIENNKFKPTDLDVKTGDTVEWINKDSVKHTVTFEDNRLNEVLANGAITKHTFKELGEGRYFCRFHPGMQANVKVS